jgi:BirA family biotin operon repressor/biotin-[acetyl-CoA-carboxylase] ligase
MGLGTEGRLIVLNETDSTNREAMDRAAAGAVHGTVIVARRQTAGRGRQGRAWLTGDGALTLSVIVRGHGVDGLLPLRAGLAVARLAGPSARVKWPNDVLLDGRKIAGVLVESAPAGVVVPPGGGPATAQPTGTEGPAAIIGIGVNVAEDPAALDPSLAGRAGTLGRRIDELDAVRDQLLVELTDALALDAPTVVASLAARDALAGRAIAWTVVDAGERHDGHAEGFDTDGRLKVRLPTGELLHLSGGEVHLG